METTLLCAEKEEGKQWVLEDFLITPLDVLLEKKVVRLGQGFVLAENCIRFNGRFLGKHRDHIAVAVFNDVKWLKTNQQPLFDQAMHLLEKRYFLHCSKCIQKQLKQRQQKE